MTENRRANENRDGGSRPIEQIIIPPKLLEALGVALHQWRYYANRHRQIPLESGNDTEAYTYRAHRACYLKYKEENIK